WNSNCDWIHKKTLGIQTNIHTRFLGRTRIRFRSHSRTRCQRRASSGSRASLHSPGRRPTRIRVRRRTRSQLRLRDPPPFPLLFAWCAREILRRGIAFPCSFSCSSSKMRTHRHLSFWIWVSWSSY
ncbi:hypothetical protein PanWU01x14_026590, partial [Parasponia andersonii]